MVFAYRPADEMRINSQPVRRDKSPDFGKFLDTAASRTATLDVGKEEHVLILELLGGSKNKDPERPGSVLPRNLRRQLSPQLRVWSRFSSLGPVFEERRPVLDPLGQT